ncbi:glutamine synthetase beta-grasp domain-containing protein [Pontibacter sp. G13]|uniref:glutamine synthetase beta-grasp domain-containing protein n=1 Tax=Pontibacter sp. G13 TaxID=3074898 RepID=UPI002889D007|nr:glutamine synthetase beta-grasp domain-containing protein [Pontibacter sp. G13]WNJ18420.1 glutamine synthetase beta-grasp domain-containing protein [Pontibacter sp. G13]
MSILKCEYIWLDGYKPEPNLRSKTKIVITDEIPTPENLPLWSYDGSSTMQAEGSSSDCILKPVRVVKDAGREDGYLVMCEVLNPDGTPHLTNKRATYEDQADYWFGFEQEYVIMKDGRPLGFPKDGYPAPQGEYYCGVGHEAVIGRELVEEHLNLCLKSGLRITGVNAEVMLGQWEFQLLGIGAKAASDDLWIARYLLQRVSESHGVTIDLHPKPVKGDWNGSGMHTNFSNEHMRTVGGKEYFEGLLKALENRHEAHIAAYGAHNHERLTGLHETQAIDTFSYGVSDRGASIRIPISTVEDGWVGYLEDRRPGSNADPYEVTAALLETLPTPIIAA